MSEFEEDLLEEQRSGNDLPPVHHIEPKMFIGLVTLILLAVYIVVLFLTEARKTDTVDLMPIYTDTSVTASPSILSAPRVDLGQEQPKRFTTDFAPATSTPLVESYEVTYPHGVQSTVLYATVQPVPVVFADFKSRLETAGFIVVKTYESGMVSALYAMKEGSELNVTIANVIDVDGVVSTTQVTISHFDK